MVGFAVRQPATRGFPCSGPSTRCSPASWDDGGRAVSQRTLVFFEGRFILGLTGLETAGVGLDEAVIWSCLAVAVPLADVVNDWHELRLAARAPASLPARAGSQPRTAAAPPI